MAKITFSTTDYARAQPPEKGMHLFEITETSEKISSGKDSTNYYFTFKVIESAVDDKNVDRSIQRVFNSKAPGFLIDFLAAVKDKKIDEMIAELRESGDSFDTDDLIGEKVWCEVVDEIYEGRAIRRMSDNWASASSKPAF